MPMFSNQNARLVRFKKSALKPKNHRNRELVARYGNGPFLVVLELDSSITILTTIGSQSFPESCFEDIVDRVTSVD